MKVVDLREAKRLSVGIMAFGFFDCIHLGHQVVIREAVNAAKRRGVPSSVFLFKNNIFPLIGIDKAPVFTFEERISFIRDLGVDILVYVEADSAYLALSPQAFLQDLSSHLVIEGTVCGKDFSFGSRGTGRASDLAALGSYHSILDLYEIDGEKVSTEAIKGALSVGDLDKASRFLGRRFSIQRRVGSGRRDGGKMGYPTLNTELSSVMMKQGVYFTRVRIGEQEYRALTNIGAHPTFDDYSENAETYLLDYTGDLYGEEVSIEFLTYHREIVKFPRVEDLVKQIERDVVERRQYD